MKEVEAAIEKSNRSSDDAQIKTDLQKSKELDELNATISSLRVENEALLEATSKLQASKFCDEMIIVEEGSSRRKIFLKQNFLLPIICDFQILFDKILCKIMFFHFAMDSQFHFDLP